MRIPFCLAPAPLLPIGFPAARLRIARILTAGGLAGSLAAGTAMAQVTTNRGALDSLGTQAPGAHSGSHHHAASAAHPARHSSPPPRTPARPAHAAVHAPAATIPAAPPPPPVFRAPVINVPLHPPPPPPPVPVVQTAQGSVAAIDGGTRISFGAGSADLNPAMMQALHAFADRLKGAPQSRADVNAMSSGTADDPSTPRRIALERGLAARAVLINDGIASTRIYVRVMDVPAGPKDGPAPPDRIDMLLSSVPGSDAPVAAPSPAPGGSVP
jgi:outer membrane protein OmpA-like peptidoglycan-associated protein